MVSARASIARKNPGADSIAGWPKETGSKDSSATCFGSVALTAGKFENRVPATYACPQTIAAIRSTGCAVLFDRGQIPHDSAPSLRP